MKNLTLIISLLATLSAGVLHPMKRPADLLEPSLTTSKKIHLEFMQDVDYAPLLGSELQEECDTQEKIETERSFLEGLKDFIGSLPSNIPEPEESTSKIEKEDFSETSKSAHLLLTNHNTHFVCSDTKKKSTERIIPILSTVVAQSAANNIDKKFPCTFEGCNKSFPYNSHLTQHMRTHTGEKTYACKFCDKSFSQNSNLTTHIRTHTGEKPYPCRFCNKSFSRSDNLDNHMRIHTGEKPYACTFCDKSFSDNSSLTKHMRTHTGKKPYACTFCNKSFSMSCSLTTHIRTHTGEKPYPCRFCNKSFSRSDNLTKHMRTHTGEKPYPCDLCDKSFSQNSNLTAHIRTHTREKLHLCTFCNQSFMQSDYLKKHLQKQHTDKKS